MTSHTVKDNEQGEVTIRPAEADDFQAIWPFFCDIVRAGETYAFPRDCDYQEGLRLWLTVPDISYVASLQGRIVGSYYLKPNMSGPGDHVCNCGYMVDPVVRGRGIARAMCVHSQRIAIDRGYCAMQFNSVVSTNHGAIRLWQSLGFEIVGRLPKAFRHARLGYVDSLVMYRWLISA